MENTQRQNFEVLVQGQRSLGEFRVYAIPIGSEDVVCSRFGVWEQATQEGLESCDSMCPLTDGSGATSASAGGLSSF